MQKQSLLQGLCCHVYRMVFVVWLLSLCGSVHADGSSLDWALKSPALTLSPTLVQDTLAARGASGGIASLEPKQRTALMQELFMRETLLAQGQQVSATAMAGLSKQVEDYRKTQWSRLVLDSLALEGVPDFNARAEELYAARKDTQYQLPLRLRVRVLEQHTVGTAEASTNTALESIRAEIQAGKLDFRQAVLTHSDAEDKKLTEGDSFWFDATQKAPAFFAVAAKLTAEQPLSEVFAHQGRTYLLQFIGRQEAMQQTYAEVKPAIVAELTEAYQQAQRKLILEKLRNQFQQTAIIHPDYQ